MNPPMVLKDGRLWAVFGTPGADNQVQINFQIATAMIDFGLDPNGNVLLFEANATMMVPVPAIPRSTIKMADRGQPRRRRLPH